MTYASATHAVAMPVAGHDGTAAIDRGHLAQMTFGDAKLEREVLRLFDRQADILLERMKHVPPAAVSALAHTLKGSARSIGAWDVAQCAEGVELADGTLAEFQAALGRLADAVSKARACIADLLRTH